MLILPEWRVDRKKGVGKCLGSRGKEGQKGKRVKNQGKKTLKEPLRPFSGREHYSLYTETVIINL